MTELLAHGNSNRMVGATHLNQASSRSHAILQMLITTSVVGYPNELKQGRLTMIDLAGSERLSRGNGSQKHLRESAAISKSLLALGGCISGLVRLQHCHSKQMLQTQIHIPYRDSKLTRVLRDSLVNLTCNVSMIVTLNPLPEFYDATFSTLAFANKIKQIKIDSINRLNMFKYQRAPSSELENMDQANLRLRQISSALIIKPRRLIKTT